MKRLPSSHLRLSVFKAVTGKGGDVGARLPALVGVSEPKVMLDSEAACRKRGQHAADVHGPPTHGAEGQAGNRSVEGALVDELEAVL